MATTGGMEKQSPQLHDSTQSSAVRGDLSVSSPTAPPAAPAAAPVTAAPVAAAPVIAAGSTRHAAVAQRGGSGSSSSNNDGDHSEKKRMVKQKKQKKQKKRAKRSKQQEKLKLWCAVVGRPGCLAVLINEDKYVGDLQDAILKKQKYFGFPASEMNLFLAKDGDSWLAPTHEDGVALRKGEVNGSIEVRLRDKPLSSMDTIGEAIADAGLELPPPAKHIHVLAMLPTQQTTGSRAVAKSGAGDEMEEKAVTPLPPVWKTEQEPEHIIPGDDMNFVNCDAAIQQLLDIHIETFERASTGVGATWRIPIADNVFGLGKSDLERHYIRKCRDIWAELGAKENDCSAGELQLDSQALVSVVNENHDSAQPALTPTRSVSVDASLSPRDLSSEPSEPLLESEILFWETLCGCHTVHIEFGFGALFREDYTTRTDHYHKVTIGLLKTALMKMLEVPPQIFADPPSHSTAFLRAVTKEVGPLFIVLDEIDRAFNDPARPIDTLQQRELFMLFCKVVLLSWMKLPSVFFVLLGRAEVLSTVGLQPSDVCMSQFKLERLRLNRL